MVYPPAIYMYIYIYIVSSSFKYTISPHCSRAKAYFGHVLPLYSSLLPHCSLVLPLCSLMLSPCSPVLPRCSPMLNYFLLFFFSSWLSISCQFKLPI